MITREKLQAIFNNDERVFREQYIDHNVKAITLLRDKIPYDICKGIISGAEHDIVYLCDVDDVLEHLNEEDVVTLFECNIFIDIEIDCLAMFV